MPGSHSDRLTGFRALFRSPSHSPNPKSPLQPPSESDEMKRRRRRDWSALPPELLGLISRKLSGIEDFTRFRAVCTSWCAAAEPSDLPRQLPWLMLPPKLPEKDGEHAAEYSATREFFSLADHKLYRIHLPETRSRICCSAGHGWLLVTGWKGDVLSRDPPKDPELFLLNPLTRARIPLPPQTAFQVENKKPFVSTAARIRHFRDLVENKRRDRSMSKISTWFVDKAVLSSNPTTSADWTLAVILNNSWRLAFYRAGDSFWKVTDDRELYCHHSLTHLNGSFYVSGYRMISAVDFSSSKGITYPIRRNLDGLYTTRDYLAQSAGELLLMERYDLYTLDEDCHTLEKEKELFDVFKMDSAGVKPSWSQVHSLGDRALFISRDNSLSISLADLPGRYRPNCIYFTDKADFLDFNEEDRSIGVFSLEDSSIEMIHCCPDDSPEWWRASWVLPSLC